MKALIKYIVNRAIAKVVRTVFEENDTSDIAEAAAEKVCEDVRHDRSFPREVANELDLDEVASKVCENFEPDYTLLSNEVDVRVVAEHVRDGVIDELMERLPTPLRALIDLGSKEPEPEAAVKPELVERLLDRAVEKLLTLAGEMAENGDLHE